MILVNSCWENPKSHTCPLPKLSNTSHFLVWTSRIWRIRDTIEAITQFALGILPIKWKSSENLQGKTLTPFWISWQLEGEIPSEMLVTKQAPDFSISPFFYSMSTFLDFGALLLIWDPKTKVDSEVVVLSI